MPPFRALRVTYLSLPVLVLVFALAFSLRAQNVVPDHATGSTPLPNGIEIQAGNAREQITALRDDVLRVRIAPHGQMPEDASWAVSAENRHSSVPITPSASAGAISFRTRSLSVEVDPKTLRLTVRDLAGNIVQQDAQPIYYDGAAFRVYKTMPLDEHYYGLGDRTGPLDRRDESFTLWNTDAFASRNPPTLSIRPSPSSLPSAPGTPPVFFSTTPGAPASTSASNSPTSTPSDP